MAIDAKRATIIRKIASGATLSATARDLGISTTRVTQLLNTGCRMLKLSSDIVDIRANPAQYLASIPGESVASIVELRPALQRDLVRRLSLTSLEQLTPERMINYSAADLVGIELTMVAVAEIQEWLAMHGKRLRHGGPIRTKAELRELERAVRLLEAYCFPVADARAQLADEAAHFVPSDRR